MNKPIEYTEDVENKNRNEITTKREFKKKRVQWCAKITPNINTVTK